MSVRLYVVSRAKRGVRNMITRTLGLLALIAASPTLAQFSPSDLKDLQEKTVPVAEVAEVGNASANLKSANGICEAARRATVGDTPFIAAKTDLEALRASAQSLTPDAKDQFETAAEYDARQVARRMAWAQNNQFFVLPTPVNSGANVYNAETQTYVIGPSGSLELKPGSWDNRYNSGSGFVAIKITGKFPQIQAQMDPQAARQFFAQSADHEIVYVVQPIAPYFQRESYSYWERNHLLTSISCRFVRRKTEQRVLYYYSP